MIMQRPKFHIIVISHPGVFPGKEVASLYPAADFPGKEAVSLPHSADSLGGEAEYISALLESGLVDCFHIRKPGWSAEEYARLLRAIPSRLYPFLSLHDHFSLAQRMGLGGIHLNSRNPAAPDGFKGRQSRSCHSLEEVTASAAMDYVTLSPVYDSISKVGYKGVFNPASPLSLPAAPPVIALGGVTPSNIPELKAAGFAGAAFLGYPISVGPANFIKELSRFI